MEFNEIKKAFEKAVAPAEKYRHELIESNKLLHEKAWPIVEEMPRVKVNEVATSTADLVHLNQSKAVTSPIPDKLRRELESSMKKTKMIIEENIDLRIR